MMIKIRIQLGVLKKIADNESGVVKFWDDAMIKFSNIILPHFLIHIQFVNYNMSQNLIRI